MSEVSAHQQIAALLAMDIDIMAKVAERDNWDENDLREIIFRLKKEKDLLISDDKRREMRYTSITNLANIASKKCD